MPAPRPRMHGITHVPGGPDPIPGLGCSSIVAHGDFGEYVASLSDLIGYWRLGETGAPWLDTSPYANAHLSLNALGTHHIVADVTGALPAAQDDGAVEFTGSAFVQGDNLIPAVTSRFELVSTAYTLACWVKLNSDCGAGSLSLIVGTYAGAGNYGWGLVAGGGQVIYHVRTATGGSPSTAAVGPAVVLDEWVYVVATWSPSTGHQLFYNASLVDTDPGTTTVPNFGLKFGSMNTGGPVYGAFDGSVDEVAIWSRVLTDDEIGGLYARSAISEAVVPAGYLRTADGAGGCEWVAPGGSGSADVQVFTAGAAQTWTKPADVSAVWVCCIGAGGGGGGGGDPPAAGTGSGGAGGGGAARVTGQFAAANLGSTVNVDVGTGGTAGLGVGDVVAGDGGPSRFGTSAAPYVFAGGGGGGVIASGSGAGGGGGGSMANSGAANTAGAPSGATSGVAGQSGTGPSTPNPGISTDYGGASGGSATSNGVGQPGGSSLFGGSGGGGGGGKAASVGLAGGAGGARGRYTAGGGGAGGAAGAPGVPGGNGDPGSDTIPGTGGGGGGAGNAGATTAGGAGGNGGIGSGGGGGGCNVGGSGPAGGAGGDGRVVVISW